MPRLSPGSDSEPDENGDGHPARLLNKPTPIREKKSRSPAAHSQRDSEEKVVAGPSTLQVRDDGDTGDEDEDDDDEEDEEVYVVEKVIKHEIMPDEGTVYYEIKWKNYPNTENTWEPEDNLEGARDLLEAYFSKIGGHPTEVAKVPKKRGRKSAGQSPPAKKTKAPTAPTRVGRRGMKLEEEEDGWGTPWPNVKVTSDWMPPKPRKDAWEDILLDVQTISVDPDGTKWAFVLWSVEDEKGVKRKGKVLLDSVSVAAPQAIIKFYERHLVFTQNEAPVV